MNIVIAYEKDKITESEKDIKQLTFIKLEMII